MEETTQTMEIYDNERVTKILSQYKNNIAKNHERYLKYKQDPEFVEQNKLRSRAHYEATKEAKKEKYEKNKQFLNYKSLYNYYRIRERIDDFKEKYPERVIYLEERGFKV